MNQVIPTEQETGPGLVTELDLGSACGGKAGSREPLVVLITRPLTEDDLPAISNPPVVGSSLPRIKALRHSHHRLAQLIAEGKDQAEISLLTGYSVSYISGIQSADPAFAELVGYYSHQREQIFVDAVERMKSLGLDAAGELHERLREQTEKFSNRELMEVIELALGPSLSPKGGQPGAPQGAGTSVSLEVRFVAPGGVEGQPSALEGTFTDLTPKEPPR